MIYGTLGYILGGPRIATRRSLAFDTGMRNEAAALLIATSSFSDQPNVAVVVVVFGMMQFVIMGAIAYYWSKKTKGSQLNKYKGIEIAYPYGIGINILVPLVILKISNSAYSKRKLMWRE
ncbi:MAG: hypothetical protein JO327_06155 [Nitrososphaeraceae archaeon]|nr:hypothetical protein [Nitrososphaeraceae archaeon]